MSQDCWVLTEGEGPRPNPGDIACWLQNVTQTQGLTEEEGCPEGKACFEVPEGLRGPHPGDTLCWPGKGKSGPVAGTKSVWEAKRNPREPNKITWEGHPADMQEVFNAFSPKAAGNNRVVPIIKRSPKPVNAFRPGRQLEDCHFPESAQSKPQFAPTQPNYFNPMDMCSPYRPGSFNPNLMGRSVSTASSSSSTSSYGKFRFNANFCNCKIPLPPWCKEKKRKKQCSKKSAPPLCAITCGNPKCAAGKFSTQEYKCVPISRGYYEDPKPGMCCYLCNQTVFNTSDKKGKMEEGYFSQHSCPTYSINSGRDHPFQQSQKVQLIKPVAKSTVDNENDSFLLNLSKTDNCGKPAKLNLSFKIPKTKITYKYDVESQFPDIKPKKRKKAGSAKKGKKSRKGKKGGKGKKKGAKGKKGKSAAKKKKK